MNTSAGSFRESRFTVAPHARVEAQSFHMIWPQGGLPVAFDPAAAAILDCFGVSASPQEVADDLVAALGLEPDTALRAAVSTALALRQSGHIIAEGQVPMPASLISYPAGASP